MSVMRTVWVVDRRRAQVHQGKLDERVRAVAGDVRNKHVSVWQNIGMLVPLPIPVAYPVEYVFDTREEAERAAALLLLEL